MRASDTDRQRTVEELRRHCAAGRIDIDEYASRIERALSATSLEELDALRSDLPMMRIADPAGRGIWARGGAGDSRAPQPAGRFGELAPAGTGRSSARDSDPVTTRQRLMATAVAVVSVLVVFTAILLSLATEWTWAAVLIVGWLVGLLQGWLGRRARRLL